MSFPTTIPLVNDTSISVPNKKPAAKHHSAVSWSGRQVRVISDFFIELGHGLAQGAKKIVRVVGKLSMDATSLARFCRLGITAFAVIEKCIGKPGIFTNASSQIATAESMIYTLNAGDQVKYFGVGKQKKESLVCSLGQGALLAAGIGGVFVFLGKVTLLNFSKISQAIGSIPVFGAITKLGVGLGQVVSGVAGLGFGLLAVDAAIKLSKAKTTQEKVQKTIDLAWMVAETALAVFCATGVKSFVAIAVLAVVAAGLGITSFVYSMHVQDQKEKAEVKA